MLELYTFTMSTFSEKVRWALEWERLPFQERRLLPGPHGLVTRRLAPRTEVPVLVHDGHAVQGSSAILDYLETTLQTRKLADSADAAHGRPLEQRIDRALGRGIQRLFYDVLLHDRRCLIRLWSLDQARWTHAMYTVIYPWMSRGIRRLVSDYSRGRQGRTQRISRGDDRAGPAARRTPLLGR